VADKVELVPLMDRTTTGNFEVTVAATGQVLHSKTSAGQGRAQTPQERQAILVQIQQLLLVPEAD
jgi:hypothetical protein